MHRLLDPRHDEVVIREYVEREARYHGMRLSAEEYFALEDDGCRYELIDGVVCMSPSPGRKHQLVTIEIGTQLRAYLKVNPVGEVVMDTDVRLEKNPTGRDFVYRPDILFFKSGRIPKDADRYEMPPDLVVEVVSISTRRYDRETKKADYERVGVSEYWIIDPRHETMNFYHPQEGRYVEVFPEGDRFASVAAPGFVLDLAELRKTFESM